MVSTIGKSGGQQFHGEAYLYARHFIFNADDWINEAAGRTLPVYGMRPRRKLNITIGFQIAAR